jgi:adenylate cyclase
MKESPARQALDRIRAIVARDTGRPLGPLAEAELDEVLRDLKRDALPPAGGEFLSREVTILLADLRGFTAIATANSAGVVIEALNECLIRMSEIIFRHQGTIDKFMGDSIMVLFGAPESREDDVQRSLACAVEMQIAMNELNLSRRERGMLELFMGIGINTGTVLAGTLGSERYSEYTVIGDEVNVASRIEAFSLRGQVLISQSTYERCRELVETGESMDIHVKGKPLPVSLRELVAMPSRGLKVPRQEIRRSHRVDVNIPVRFRVVQDKIVLPEMRSATICDIGYHGMLIESQGPLPLHAELNLEFDLPLVDYRAREVYGKVVSCKAGKGGGRAGVEFTAVPAETNTKIQLFVQLLVFTDLNR